MKRIFFFSILLIFYFTITAKSQNEITLGIGYFGETIFHPGLVAQVEYDKFLTNKISIPIRTDIGYYIHKRNHQAIFSELITGIRWHFLPRWHAGLNAGVGLMASWHHSDDGVFIVDNSGNISRTTSFAGLDFMPSTGFEFAYKIKEGSKNNYIWLRPKAFWQMNVNERALFHFALEIGYSFTLNSKTK